MKTINPERVSDGAGVALNRVFGNRQTSMTDPFLLLDHLKNDDPDKGMPGFPWHPHRGIETITYMLTGGIQHEDSLGNKGELKSGDVQWMTAGSGIIHQEMPLQGAGNIYHGFQLWSNLPSSHKMMSPRYQDIPSLEIPEVTEDDGSLSRIITGDFRGKTGPVKGIITDPTFLDFTVPPEREVKIPMRVEQNSFAYVFEGSAYFKDSSESLPIDADKLVLFDSGEEIRLKSGIKGVRFLFLSGRPLGEKIAWWGPIVMNSKEELIQAYDEYEKGTFLKHAFSGLTG